VPFREIEQLTVLQPAKFLQADLNCRDAVKARICELLPIATDPDTDGDGRELAMETVYELPIPNSPNPFSINRLEEESP
jgi:hypothetical protein